MYEVKKETSGMSELIQRLIVIIKLLIIPMYTDKNQN